MIMFRTKAITAAISGAIWAFVAATTTAIAVSFATGLPYRPEPLWIVAWGTLSGFAVTRGRMAAIITTIVLASFGLFGFGIISAADPSAVIANLLTHIMAAAIAVGGTYAITVTAPNGALTRHEFEEVVIRLCTAIGYVFFTAIVVIPFYVMLMTSFKNQSELVQNPLDFSLDLSKGWDLFRSYYELFANFEFGTYLANSMLISVITVFITLAFSIPGAYAVARLRFSGRTAFSRSILLIYMVPMIVLALRYTLLFP